MLLQEVRHYTSKIRLISCHSLYVIFVYEVNSKSIRALFINTCKIVLSGNIPTPSSTGIPAEMGVDFLPVSKQDSKEGEG